MPQVIEDAMVVVRNLDRRYLWVDKYCIDQKDHDEKDLQIRNMDRIYENAFAALVASAGQDSEFGLPGVGPKPRKPQPSATIEYEILLSTLPPLSCVLKESAWITRGWTYQEAILSRRCLFFTECQVYFVCRAISCCEAIVTSISKKDKSNLDGSTKTSISADIFGLARFGGKPSSELRELADHIREYTGRNLTVQDDALNAFRGMLMRSYFHSYFGIPLAFSNSQVLTDQDSEQDWNRAFARGLYWTPDYEREKGNGAERGSLSRRTDFPSWSWCGWRGRIEYCPAYGPGSGLGEEELMEVDRAGVSARFWARDSNATMFPLKELWDPKYGTRMIRELSNCIVLETWTVRFRLQPYYGSNFYICRCHPFSTHEGPTINIRTKWGNADFCQHSFKDDDSYRRRVTNLWECLLLFESEIPRERFCHLLIVERNGETARRVGTVSLRDLNRDFHRLPKEKQIIRLE